MSPSPWQWLWPLAFYLVGSIPTGYLLGRAKGLDIRQHGSGNIGATNVWRVMGWKWGLPAFLLDVFKGFLPLFLLRMIAFPGIYVTRTIGLTTQTALVPDASWQTQLLLVLCGLAAIIGHNYTPWLGFKGGKGIATSAGVLAALMPPVLAVSFSLWCVLTLATRYVSVGSIAAALSLIPLAWYFYPGEWILFGLACLACVLAIYRHKSNIQRLLAGTESRFSFGKKKGAS
ncbi:MAG TPA: glycerol-3-phosphate 1-O-acyltransferase PlsY [Candidatus Methylacidiphilales bacterium]|jgi:glycerol-3-phosphate acyltransferase PlsY|nr:glycerol-3-phosphate 1-O-acyltransferase PlsY [Candidatus Methylacidiphilales bacterium]